MKLNTAWSWLSWKPNRPPGGVLVSSLSRIKVSVTSGSTYPPSGINHGTFLTPPFRGYGRGLESWLVPFHALRTHHEFLYHALHDVYTCTMLYPINKPRDSRVAWSLLTIACRRRSTFTKVVHFSNAQSDAYNVANVGKPCWQRHNPLDAMFKQTVT